MAQKRCEGRCAGKCAGGEPPKSCDTGSAGETPPVLKFERRTVDRWTVRGHATAICLGGDRFGKMYDLNLRDCSDDGLGAVTSEPIEPGATVSIGFQTPGMLARRATVLRCQPCGDGYRVGMQYALKQAA